MPKTIQVSAMIGKKQWAYLLKIARSRGLSASAILRHVIAEFQEEHPLDSAGAIDEQLYVEHLGKTAPTIRISAIVGEAQWTFLLKAAAKYGISVSSILRHLITRFQFEGPQLTPAEITEASPFIIANLAGTNIKIPYYGN